MLVDVNLGPVRDFDKTGRLIVQRIRPRPRAYLAAAGDGITVNDVLQHVASKDVAGLLAVANTIQRGVYDTAINVLRPQLQKTYADNFAQRALVAIVFPTTPLPGAANQRKRRYRSGHREDQRKAGADVSDLRSQYRSRQQRGAPWPVGANWDDPCRAAVGLEFDGPVNSDRTLSVLAWASRMSSVRSRRRRFDAYVERLQVWQPVAG